jgi:hypothetical protein
LTLRSDARPWVELTIVHAVEKFGDTRHRVVTYEATATTGSARSTLAL